MDIFLSKKKNLISCLLISTLGIATFLSGCGGSDDPISDFSKALSEPDTPAPDVEVPEAERVKGSRDNTPVCLVPEAPGDVVYENEYAKVDASNTSEGYIVVTYLGESPKVKLQITGPAGVTYTYNISSIPKEEVFPLQQGNGEYMVNVFENIEGTQYSQAYSQML